MSGGIINAPLILKTTQGTMLKEVPEPTKAFLQLLRTAEKDDALSTKQKQLICLGISLFARCQSCIIHHTKLALKAGASREEILSACGVTLSMGGSPIMFGISTVLDALEAFDIS